ncbi:MAG TPA: glycosyltransferase [Ramlibacter sp.]|uniref:glycosyltransferase n=1 Tax=Ramlibacter sp. TaxID=1917967 RepID=UPI002B7C6501|nr:glycosyltransferase [Ramlibacter sp.]HVZ46405.1 glycosyltransferase [Ramlibacter sp.]
MSSPACVDICIVNYFGAADVREALRVLGPWPRGRILVVDNSADASEAQALAQALRGRDGVECIDAQANLGFGRGCNLAYARSSAAFFLLLNPDARITAAALEALVKELEAQPRCAALSPRMWWNPRRTFLLPAAFAQTPAYTLSLTLAPRFRALARIAARHHLRHQRALMECPGTSRVDFLSGAVLLVRREAVDACGGLFDPDYFMFFEDSDLSLRLRAGGWTLGVSGAADAVHEYRHKASKGPLMAQARDIYFRKRYPLFWRLSGGLRRVDALARPLRTAPSEVLPRPCRTLEDFHAQAGTHAVEAFSPSPLLMPAIFRPRTAAPSPFTQDEWQLLEPARYAALLRDAAGAMHWVHFDRA